MTDRPTLDFAGLREVIDHLDAPINTSIRPMTAWDISQNAALSAYLNQMRFQYAEEGVRTPKIDVDLMLHNGNNQRLRVQIAEREREARYR